MVFSFYSKKNPSNIIYHQLKQSRDYTIFEGEKIIPYEVP